MKIKIITIVLVLLIPISLALTGTRSLTSECEDSSYRITITPTTGYAIEEILSASSNWHFSSLSGNAANDCTIQTDDTRVRCSYLGSGTRTLIFNVLNAPGTYNNIFSNDPDADQVTGLFSVEIKPDECTVDNDNDKYPGSITNTCGCISSDIDCNDNNPDIYPGAPEIQGDGIDQDCDGSDTLLPSTVDRILPNTIQVGVESEIILNIRCTGEEPSYVIDETFNQNDFDCSKKPTYGECSNGKIRWVVTNPSFTSKLKYYLIPKKTSSCFNGIYKFEGRNEKQIIGDYAIEKNCMACSPTREEICDNDIDEDCDGSINMCCECSGTSCEPGNTGRICDGCSFISGPQEVCDGVDNDCDGNIDENVKIRFYKDVDGDGYGDPASSVQSCTNPGNYVDNNYDCDDTKEDINPDAEEICNGIDDNCNHFLEYDEGIDCCFDNDNDGYTTSVGCLTGNDCDDNNANIHPGAMEKCGNTIDENCNGIIPDVDNDGYCSASNQENCDNRPPEWGEYSCYRSWSPKDCDDNSAKYAPGKNEYPGQPDYNCDGKTYSKQKFWDPERNGQTLTGWRTIYAEDSSVTSKQFCKETAHSPTGAVWGHEVGGGETHRAPYAYYDGSSWIQMGKGYYVWKWIECWVYS